VPVKTATSALGIHFMPTRVFQLPPMGSLQIQTHSRRDTAQPQRDLFVTVQALPDVSSPSGEVPPLVAEICGAELPNGEPVFIPYDRRVSLFSPRGCIVSVDWDEEGFAYGITLGANPADGNCFHINVLSIHKFLERRRHLARQQANQEGMGPRTLIVGSVPSAGKSVLCRTLANYGTRGGYQPLYVDLNVRLPSVGYPECVSVLSLQTPIDVEEEGSFFPALWFHFGESAPHRNVPLWRHTLQHVANGLLQRAARCDRSRVGGVFMDYPTIDEEAFDAYDEALSKGGGVPAVEHPLDALVATLEILEVDVLVVVGSDFFRWRLMEHLHRCASGVDLTLNGIIAGKTVVAQQVAEQNGYPTGGTLKIGSITAPAIPFAAPLSTGNVLQAIPFPPVPWSALPRSSKLEELAVKQRWLQFFFGTVTSPLRPSTLEVSLSSCKLVRIGGAAAQSMAGLLPLDEDATAVDPAVVSYLMPGDMNLDGRVVALSSAVYLKPRLDGATDANGDILYDPVSTKVFEDAVKELRVIGFGLIRQSTHASVTMVLPEALLPQARGHCWLVTNTTLLTT
jgi:polyribonucleotide 5'-hydroxyl-kinase